MGLFSNSAAKVAKAVKDKFTMRFVFKVMDTPDHHDVAVRVWIFASATKGTIDQKLIDQIKREPFRQFDVDANEPRSFEWTTSPGNEGYLYIIAEPLGVWQKHYQHLPEVREEQIRTGEDNKFILGLFEPQKPELRQDPTPDEPANAKQTAAKRKFRL